MDAATDGFLDRMGLTARLDDNIVPFLEDHGFSFMSFGHPAILKGNGSIRSRVLHRDSKKSDAMLMIKFSPDFIGTHEPSNAAPFYLDTKASITPVFFGSQIDRIRQEARLVRLMREDIGVIEREAWDVYNRFYPKERVMLCLASPYHPRLLLAEWVSNIMPLFRFAADHNIEAEGSGTPHVNVHMGKMRTLSEFISQEFGIEVDAEGYQIMCDYVKQWTLSKPGRVNWTQYNNVIVDLQATCPWLKTRNEPPNWRPQRNPRPMF
jgi:hypothetical protein